MPDREELRERIDALEARGRAEDRLVDGVERLSGETSSLNQILSRVDEQQRRLVNLDKRVEDKASKDEVIGVASAARKERQRNLRKIYALVGGALLIALAGSVGGAWFTDLHIQNCLLHGPNTANEHRLCDMTFPGHDHPPGLSLDALLARGAANQVASVKATRRGCERTQARVQIEIEKEQTLGRVDVEVTHAAHLKAAELLKTTLIDCNAEFPLPGGAK